MKKKIRYITAVFILIVLGLLSISSTSSLPYSLSTATPKPKIKPTEIPLDSQVGHSDGILILGILIFVIIAVPLIIKHFDHPKSTQTQKDKTSISK